MTSIWEAVLECCLADHSARRFMFALALALGCCSGDGNEGKLYIEEHLISHDP